MHPISTVLRTESTPRDMMTQMLIKGNQHLHTSSVHQLPAGPDPMLAEQHQVGLLPQFVDGDKTPNHLWNQRNNHLRRGNPNQHAERTHSGAVVQIGRSRHFSAFKKEGKITNRNSSIVSSYQFRFFYSSLDLVIEAT
jgi:hypothetical protein